MSELDGYEPGVPCWVAAVEPDPGSAMAGPYDVPGIGRAVLANPQGAALT